jgi:Bacterial dnaA protein helix-turn-helix
MVDRQQESIWPLTLHEIEATVSTHLGPGRVPGNEHGPCFSRQISMYRAKHVGGWSTPQIGRFYNGRHHTTAMHAIEKIERLRTSDETVDALLEVLSATLGSDHARIPETGRAAWTESILTALAERVLSRPSGHERDSSAVTSHVAKRCTLEEGRPNACR